MNSFSERLRMIRKLRGMTQAELARACQLSQGAIGNYETRARQVPREIFRLAKELRVNPQWLYDGSGPMEHVTPALPPGQWHLSDGTSPAPLAAWPFRDISPEAYWSLSQDDLALIENMVTAMMGSLLQKKKTE